MAEVTRIPKRYLLMKELIELLNQLFPGANQWNLVVYNDEVDVTAWRKLTTVIETQFLLVADYQLTWSRLRSSRSPRLTRVANPLLRINMGSVREDIWGQIGRRRKRSTDGRYYITEKDVRVVLTPEAIDAAVGELLLPELDTVEICAKIKAEGVKTFAILLWMRRESAIIEFIENGALDSSLPLAQARAEAIAPLFGKSFSQEIQWQFLPRFFSSSLRSYFARIQAEEILPFLSEVKLGEGGLGEVFLTGIDASHQDMLPCGANSSEPSLETVLVVRKRLKKLSRRSVEAENKVFREELNCLKLLCRLKHPNIVELLGAYQFNSDNNLLFRHFEMDLDAFLCLEERFGDFIHDHTFLNSLHGLSSALRSVHNLRLNAQDHDVELSRIGYHHDLRPANILVSKNTFLLADFGLAKMKSEEERSKSTYKAGGGDCLAPECMSEDYTRQPIGRAADLWSLGCTIIEVLSYMERGPEGVRELKRSRMGPSFDPRCEDHYYFGIKELKSGVLGWLNEIQIGCSTKLIPDLIRVSLSALQIDPERRPTAAKMSQGLMWVNVKHYYLEIQEAFDLYLKRPQDEISGYNFSMKMWFGRERFNSWGWVLNISQDEPDEAYTHIIEKIGPEAREKLSSMLDILRHEKVVSERNSEEYGGIPSEDFEEGVGQLIQDLWDLIPLNMQRRLETVWRNMMLESTDRAGLLKIMDFASSVNLGAYAEVRALATMKAIDISFSQMTALATHNHRLVAELFQRQVSLGQHDIGTYLGTKVLVEWIHYSPLWEDVSADERSLRLQMLAEGISQHPRPPDLRILDCLGFIENSSGRHGYGLLYSFPHPVAMPITLQSFLQRGRASIDKQPTLGTKLCLASALVHCMIEFHNIGWLHKNFHSGNIIFFGEDPSVLSLARGPYLIDLRTSRPDSEKWYSEPPVYDHTAVLYQHPDYQRTHGNNPQRYRVEFDYYSLGCVLLEIGSWQPLKDLRDNNPGISPKGFRDLLIKKYAPRLAPRVGQSYANAVIFCLEGLPDRDEAENKALYRQFYDRVLVPLEEISGCPL